MGVFLFDSQSREHRVSLVQWSSGQSAEQGVVTPIGPVLTSATAVKNFDRPNWALTA